MCVEVLNRQATYRKQILIVDDETEVSGLLKTRFESLGYTIRTAATGQAALDCVKQEIPDLVILDLKLPDISGYEVCRRLREFSKPWQIPVLMLTGLCQPADELRGYAFGADAYLTKPFESDRLLKVVEELLNDSKGWREKHLPKELLEHPQAVANLPKIFRALREGYVEGSLPPVTQEKEGIRRGVDRREILTVAGAVLMLLLAVTWAFNEVVAPRPPRFAITEAVLCREVDRDRGVIGAASEFPKGIDKITCWFSWKGAPPDLHILGQWYYVTQENPILDIPVILTQNSSEGKFLLQMPAGVALPVGVYRFDFIVRGRVIKTIPFTVGVDRPSPGSSQ